MLTPPKWQLVWLKSQHSLRSSSKKTMFSKPSDKIFDDLSKCCSSLSKELTLEALGCWRIWLEYQEFDDWKQNEICYSAIRPLITKKFHPLAKDTEVIVNKLNLMWFAIEKVQSFMHLEGPQYILEVFIQSCINWLSYCEELDADVIQLILQLLCSLFSRSGQILFKNFNFPMLETNLVLPNKFWGRVLTSFLELFHNWMKIKEKSQLLHIWKHFLEHCETSFKFIPVSVWHKIFRLVTSICGDENESFFNKISLLHLCAISLKSVMYSSKFIDSSNLLTTPAEALLKIAVDLCLNVREEKSCFEMFNCCKEMCQVLSKSITHSFGYDFFLYLLPKMEEIECKTLFWSLWCGLAELFREEIKKLNLDEYNKTELKVFRKLRAIAVNFELDKFYLDYRSILMIQKQLGFFRIGSICEDCIICSSKLKTLTELQEKDKGAINKENISGMTGCETHYSYCEEIISQGRYFQCADEAENLTKKVTNFAGLMKSLKTTFSISSEGRWIKNCLNSRKSDSRFYPPSISICKRLIANFANRRSTLLAPIHLQRILDEIINKTHMNNDKLSKVFVENARKLQKKTKEGLIFAPVRFLVSLKGRKGVEFCGIAFRFWKLLDGIVSDVDFGKNLNAAISKKPNSILCFCMFLLLVNFTKNVFFESPEDGIKEQSGTEEEETLTMKIIKFMKNVIYCEEKHSRSDFFDDLSEFLPRSNQNPLMLLMKLNSINRGYENGREYIFKGFSNQESTLNSNSIIFNYFNEFESKVGNYEKGMKKERKGRKRTKENKNRQKPETDILQFGERSQILGNNYPKVIVIPVEVYELQNCMALSAVEATMNKFQESEDETFPDVFGSNRKEGIRTDKDFCKELEDVSSTNKISEESDIENRREEPPKRKLRSFKKQRVNLTTETREKKTEEIRFTRSFYSLRSRPLKFPNKFKDMDVRVHKEKGVKRKSSLKNCKTEESVKDVERDRTTEVEPKNSGSFIRTEKNDEAENTIDERIDPAIVHVLHSMKLVLEKEEESFLKSVKPEVKIEFKMEEKEMDSENVSLETMNIRGIKRHVQSEDDKKNAKRLKMEEFVANVKEEPMSCEDESRKCHVPMVQNRGSRMLALIPESPKIERFLDSSPSSKYQAVKFPQVHGNSRASKMLALLPERQESNQNGDINCTDENHKGKDENRACGIGGYNAGKIHHITPYKNNLLDTPKHSFRQRKSIRFDDERNETVTYFTDSPPLLILRSPRFIKP